VDLVGDDELLARLGVRTVEDRGELEEVVLREAVEALVQPGLDVRSALRDLSTLERYERPASVSDQEPASQSTSPLPSRRC
jgi:hypothetical protein